MMVVGGEYRDKERERGRWGGVQNNSFGGRLRVGPSSFPLFLSSFPFPFRCSLVVCVVLSCDEGSGRVVQRRKKRERKRGGGGEIPKKSSGGHLAGDDDWHLRHHA